ncbi:DUF2441 domain-containing protein [Rhodococcus sp. ENV425]|uniref:DUF2441 domain-containing protein n=1 Tax=Rhodococcus sp. ENV425 TaxID=2042960 RepID=UPI000C9CAF5E|nr:DUF2441 domain-containing protein [Rhodococcus sp. ENV425]PND53624.1 DUF2441 domain-containing protein [Rhodococcus sp. ENV425]
MNAGFYTVDRKGSLQQGQTMELIRFDDVDPPELQEHLDMLFPKGVTAHGDNNFVKNDTHFQISSYTIELVWENVRRAHFPTTPSRFQSVFAVETLRAAQAFRNAFGQADHKIWIVEAQSSFRANMDLLRNASTALVTSYLAHLYWAQQSPSGHSEFWETLLTPPVRVLGLADE